MSTTDDNESLQRHLRIFDGTLETTLFLHLLLQKAKHEMPSSFFQCSHSFCSPLMKDHGRLETYRPPRVPTPPLKSKGTGKVVQ